MLKVRGVWGNPGMAGSTRDDIAKYADWLVSLGINAVYMHLKGGDGRVYWPSEKFPSCIAPGFDRFDFPEILMDECHHRGIQVHAWMIDFFEGTNCPAHRAHPEWIMLDPNGKPSSEEWLRGAKWGPLWMCPAQRPGYTDQWLVPIYEEFAKRYQRFDGIHHDYIRYPGDAAPDQYCFCDYCLENMAKFNGFVHEVYPDEPFYHALYDRGYLEAHWEQSPRVLPQNWDKLDRKSKARFYLDGSFFQGGRYDLDYFLYTYRTHWITQFARLSAEAVRRVNPTMKISAAVFKNPIHSGRFIGQDWRQFAPYVDICIPMDYRDHFPGTFDQYLALLQEAIKSQKVWAGDYQQLQIGAAINFLFHEEPKGPYPEEKLERVIETVTSQGVDGMVLFCDNQIKSYQMESVLKRVWGKK